MIDLRQLRALAALDRTGSVAAAARELGWSQPTVSHHLTGLSRTTGAPVVRPTSSGTELTSAGRLWIPHARAILSRVDRGAQEVSATLATGLHRFRLGVFPTAAARLLPGVVSQMSARGYHMEVTEAERDLLITAFDELRLDAVITYEVRDAPSTALNRGPVREVELFDESFVLLVPATHRHAESDGRFLLDFAEEDWVFGRSASDPADAILMAKAGENDFTPRVGPRSDDYGVVAAYVAAGLGVALVPELAATAPLAGCSVVRLADVGLRRTISLMTNPGLPEEVAVTIEETARGLGSGSERPPLRG